MTTKLEELRGRIKAIKAELAALRDQERVAAIEDENAKLRAEVAALRATPRSSGV